MIVLIASAGYAVAQLPRGVFGGFGALRGEQGDPADGRTTSERGAETAVAHFRAIRDSHGRIIAAMTHNTDVSNSWERETEDAEYFYQFSIDGYALGINVLLYAMTH